MPRTTVRRERSRGHVEELPSGALRVAVYAGIDPESKRRHYLRETVPAGAAAARAAERALTRLLHQVDERRNPRTSATLGQLVDRHLQMLDVEATTLRTYRGYVDHHMRPLIGQVKLDAFDADVTDSFYAELRRCRAHCDRRPQVEHRTTGRHDCDQRCRPHACRPLAASSIRQVHLTFVWLAMTTGARRGELCALRWRDLDLDNGLLSVRASIAQSSGHTWEKSTKTHQQRRITVDPETIQGLGHVLGGLAANRRRT